MSKSRPFENTGLIGVEYLLMGELIKNNSNIYYEPCTNEEFIRLYNSKMTKFYYIDVKIEKCDLDENSRVILESVIVSLRFNSKDDSIQCKEYIKIKLDTAIETISNFFDNSKNKNKLIEENLFKNLVDIYGEDFINQIEKKKLVNSICSSNSFYNAEESIEELNDMMRKIFIKENEVYTKKDDFYLQLIKTENYSEKHLIRLIYIRKSVEGDRSIEFYHFKLSEDIFYKIINFKNKLILTENYFI